MKATTNNIDPIERRMQRGRKVARAMTLVVLIFVGGAAAVYPDIFRAYLDLPTEAERAEAKKQRKKNKASKPKSRLSKLDIERLAKLREAKARKHLMEILRRLEKRIMIAETKEAAVTEKFRDDPRLFDALRDLLPHHGEGFSSAVIAEINNVRKSGNGYDNPNIRELYRFSSASRSLSSECRHYQNDASEERMQRLLRRAETLQKNIASGQLEKWGYTLGTQTHRHLKSLVSNATALKNKDRDLAVRGIALPEDHPLNSEQRQKFNQTISPMTMAKLHQLSQDMATHYTNLMGDVAAGELADAAEISLPEAFEKLAFEPFAADDLEQLLEQNIPENAEGLEQFTDALGEGEASAERALEEAGGQVPGKGEEEGEGGDKSGDAEEGDGPFGSGGGDGTENSSSQGAPSAQGQLSKEAVLRSMALRSSLKAAQDRSRQITVNKEKVLANVLPGRRFSADSARKGYLFIDTWHVIGPWDASVSHNGRKINFSRIYPLERNVNLDAVYTTGKKSYIYDDERGYTGAGERDGRLSWQFYQSPTVEVRIPRAQLANDALYFAYTEVYFEQAATMSLAIASDDAARIRVNGQIVFEDTGLSPYEISEQVRQVKFKKGINKILVRLVNGPGPCRFSLLLTPKTDG